MALVVRMEGSGSRQHEGQEQRITYYLAFTRRCACGHAEPSREFQIDMLGSRMSLSSMPNTVLEKRAPRAHGIPFDVITGHGTYALHNDTPGFLLGLENTTTRSARSGVVKTHLQWKIKGR